MGIPHLTHHLSPYATRVLLPQQSSNERNPRNVVIDGPALAYHVYYLCLSRRGGARNAYEAIVPYTELGQAAVSWLEQLEQYGVSMYVRTSYRN